MNERLLIVGGSVRAAAMSARRAGFEPLAIDRFADADLRQICSEFQRYDELCQLLELGQSMPVADWIYTGPLENHPSLIEQLGRQRTLLGNEAATLRMLRDPWCLAAAFSRAGLRFPDLCAAGETPTARGWLRKPLRAAGGFGIARTGLTRPGGGDHRGSMYFQKFISGRSIGATFLGTPGRAVLIGVTEQLLGPSWGGFREFQYVGSVGPVVLLPEHLHALQRAGNCIAESFPVRGLYGVDAIVNEDGVWPVEVNPRYAASVEILEQALNVPTLQWHVAACRSGKLPDLTHVTAGEGHLDLHGKAIVYAKRTLLVDVKLEHSLCARHGEAADPMVADIPTAGTSIAVGEPIVTVFAKGGANADVQEGLRSSMADVRRLIS